MMLALTGCKTSAPVQTSAIMLQEAHRSAFSDFDLPRKIGAVENIGLQLPCVSPDGKRLLYLRSDQDSLSPLTVLGSTAPQDTPPAGVLSIWLRPIEGTVLGQRISPGRWCHSAAWSRSGNRLVYVSVEQSGTSIVVFEPATHREQKLGVAGHVNCMPRFAVDERTVIFCSAAAYGEPLRIYRQSEGGQPVALSPEGQDCVLPVLLRDDGSAVCGVLESDLLSWATAHPDRLDQIAPQSSVGTRPEFLNTWAGVPDPISPDLRTLLFYDARQSRIAALDLAARIVRRHRTGSIAACWMTERAVALATPDNLFCVDAETGVSLPLMNGPWIPARYMRDENRLILMGRERAAARLSLYAMNFRPHPQSAPAEGT
jgi:hypothetical protein